MKAASRRVKLVIQLFSDQPQTRISKQTSPRFLIFSSSFFVPLLLPCCSSHPEASNPSVPLRNMTWHFSAADAATSGRPAATSELPVIFAASTDRRQFVSSWRDVVSVTLTVTQQMIARGAEVARVAMEKQTSKNGGAGGGGGAGGTGVKSGEKSDRLDNQVSAE